MQTQKYTPTEVRDSVYEICCMGQTIGKKIEYRDFDTLEPRDQIDYMERVSGVGTGLNVLCDTHETLRPTYEMLEKNLKVNSELYQQISDGWDRDCQDIKALVEDSLGQSSQAIFKIEKNFLRKNNRLRMTGFTRRRKFVDRYKDETIPDLIKESNRIFISATQSLGDKLTERRDQVDALRSSLTPPSAPWKAYSNPSDISEQLSRRAARYFIQFDNVPGFWGGAFRCALQTGITAVIGVGVASLIGGPISAPIGAAIGAALGLVAGLTREYATRFKAARSEYEKLTYQTVLRAFRDVIITELETIAKPMKNELKTTITPIDLKRNLDYQKAKQWLAPGVTDQISHTSTVVNSDLVCRRINLCNQLIVQGGGTRIVDDLVDLNTFFDAVENELVQRPNENEEEIREQIEKFRSFNLRQEADRTAIQKQVQPSVNQIKYGLEKLIREIPTETKDEGGPSDSSDFGTGAEPKTEPSSKSSGKFDSPFMGWDFNWNSNPVTP